jgi:hypothetical protein
MKLINATALDRKSGGAQWRDLRFGGSFLEMFFDRASRSAGNNPYRHDAIKPGG